MDGVCNVAAMIFAYSNMLEEGFCGFDDRGRQLHPVYLRHLRLEFYMTTREILFYLSDPISTATWRIYTTLSINHDAETLF